MALQSQSFQFYDFYFVKTTLLLSLTEEEAEQQVGGQTACQL